MTQWVDEWLAEIEEKETQERLNLSKLQADQCLQKIAELEAKLSEVESLVAEEQMLIEQYRQTESDSIMKKVSYLSAQLEWFMRDHNAKTNDKSLALVHGQLKLRQQRDKLEIENIEQLMPIASAKGLLRVVPEAFEIDLPKLNKYVKASGDVPPGVKVITGDSKFSYITIKGGNNVEQRQSSEAGTGPELHNQITEMKLGPGDTVMIRKLAVQNGKRVNAKMMLEVVSKEQPKVEAPVQASGDKLKDLLLACIRDAVEVVREAGIQFSNDELQKLATTLFISRSKTT